MGLLDRFTKHDVVLTDAIPGTAVVRYRQRGRIAADGSDRDAPSAKYQLDLEVSVEGRDPHNYWAVAVTGQDLVRWQRAIDADRPSTRRSLRPRRTWQSLSCDSVGPGSGGSDDLHRRQAMGACQVRR